MGGNRTNLQTHILKYGGDLLLKNQKPFTSESCIVFPDGTIKPVTTIYDVGGSNRQVVKHMPEKEWLVYQDQMMKRTGEMMSHYYAKN